MRIECSVCHSVRGKHGWINHLPRVPRQRIRFALCPGCFGRRRPRPKRVDISSDPFEALKYDARRD